MPDLRVLVVARDPLARTGLAALLSVQRGLAVPATLAADETLAEAAGLIEADVAIWDLGERIDQGARLLGEVVDALPPVLALLPAGARPMSAWTAGARGVLLRDAGPTRLAAAALAVAEGMAVIDPAFAGRLLPRSGLGEGVAEPLTARELDVLTLLAEGLGNKAIADRLGVSDNTVKFHVNAILGKLGAQSRTEAVIIASRLGILLL